MRKGIEHKMSILEKRTQKAMIRLLSMCCFFGLWIEEKIEAEAEEEEYDDESDENDESDD